MIEDFGTAEFAAHKKSIIDMCYSRDRSKLVTASYQEVKIWDTTSKSCIETLKAHKEWVQTIYISPDFKMMITGGDDPHLKIWDLSTVTLIDSLNTKSITISQVSLTKDKLTAIAAVGKPNYEIQFWDLAQRSKIITLQGHTDIIRGIYLSKNEQKLLSISNDKRLIMWNLRDVCVEDCIVGHSEWIVSMAVSGDERYVLTGSYDKTVKVWDFDSGAHVWTFDQFKYPIRSLCFTNSKRRFLAISSGSEDVLKKFSLDKLQCCWTAKFRRNEMNNIRYGGKGNFVFSSYPNKVIHLRLRPAKTQQFLQAKL